MSEFQYYEWQTVDRLLTSEEQDRVEGLSSHIEVSPSRAVVTYDWSNFKYDPKEVLVKYFDAFFYYANWGSLRLMFRFPKGFLDPDEVSQYCDDEMVSFETIDEYQVLVIDFNSEDGGEWVDASLSDFIQLREELLQGDYRLLYLAWLMASSGYGDYEDEEEYEESEENWPDPPIPPGLKKLTPALQNFMHVFGIDPFLVKAAAEASPDMADSPAVNYRELVSRLSRSEADDFLVRLVEGDGGVKVALRKRLNDFLPKDKTQSAEAHTLKQLLTRAEALEKAEKERKAQEAQRAHIAEMKALAQKEPQLWSQVDDMLENGKKIASVYDQATSILERLKQLADFQDTRDIFFSRVRVFANKYSSRSSLIERWKLRGWL